MDCSHWLNCAWMAALRTNPTLEFLASLVQHYFAQAATVPLRCGARRRSGRLRLPSSAKTKSPFRCKEIELDWVWDNPALRRCSSCPRSVRSRLQRPANCSATGFTEPAFHGVRIAQHQTTQSLCDGSTRKSRVKLQVSQRVNQSSCFPERAILLEPSPSSVLPPRQRPRRFQPY